MINSISAILKSVKIKSMKKLTALMLQLKQRERENTMQRLKAKKCGDTCKPRAIL